MAFVFLRCLVVRTENEASAIRRQKVWRASRGLPLAAEPAWALRVRITAERESSIRKAAESMALAAADSERGRTAEQRWSSHKLGRPPRRWPAMLVSSLFSFSFL